MIELIQRGPGIFAMLRARLVWLFASLLIVSFAVDAKITLRVATVSAPPTLGNPFGGVGLPSSIYWGAMYEGLTGFAPDGALIGRLAESWTDVGATTWQFKLRPGVNFHNGELLTAEAVVATFGYLLSAEGQSTVVGAEMRALKSVRALDALTVVISTKNPDAILPQRLTLVPILPPKAWAERGAEGFAKTPIGTGPFQLTAWGNGNTTATFAAWPGNTRRTSRIDELVLSAIPESSARLQALLSRRVDIATALNIEDMEVLDASGIGHRAVTIPQIMSIALRTERGDASPLKDVRVRQALNYAVDRERIAREILKGLVKPAAQGAVPGVIGYNADLAPYPFDPAKAKSMLREAGHADGLTLIIELQTVTGTSAAVYQQVAADLAAVGVRLELRTTPFANWLRRYNSGDWGDIDGFSLAWNSGPMNDAIRPIKIFSCLKPNPFFCEPLLTALIEASDQELRTDRRKALLNDIQVRMHDLAPAILLMPMTHVFGISPQVRGFESVGTDILFEMVAKAP